MTIKKIEAQSPWAQSSDLVAENIAKPQAPSPKPQAPSHVSRTADGKW